MTENYFTELYAINVNQWVEKKNGLSYVSWANAWGEAKKYDPNANYTVYEDKDGRNYHNDGNTAWVKVGVTLNGIEHIEYLPIMDYKNTSIGIKNITSFNVNTAIQRCLTKAIARHGLGLYIYAGEDLPEGEEAPKKTSMYDGGNKMNDDAAFEQYVCNCKDKIDGAKDLQELEIVWKSEEVQGYLKTLKKHKADAYYNGVVSYLDFKKKELAA